MNDVLTDPVCSESGSPLTIVERDETFITVVCGQCGSSNGMEITTGPHGNPVYWPLFRIALKGDISV